VELVTSVEIGYFRSIYKEQLDDLPGVTVLFGRNDSGKSNVLRALNLFFNGETNPGEPFSFRRDLCSARKAEGANLPGARMFVYVKLWFKTPYSYRKSLGQSFWVRKQWSVTTELEPKLETSITEKNRLYLTRFLNKVKFHYIPAIKDRRIFEKLLGDVYNVVASEQEFLASLSDFSTELKERTSALSQGLLDQLALKSVIAPPTDLSDLFKSLDFEVEGNHGDNYSLTLQRGDGIQVRHIPAILAFISDKGAEDYHIWGFEEPENSLELANAIAEAEVFSRYGAHSNKQIFLTSHSPAFFALENDGVKRFFASQTGERANKPVSEIRELPTDGSQLPGELMGETPHLPVISHYLKEADHKIREEQRLRVELHEALEKSKRSILFVEGESDAIVFEAAWKQFTKTDLPFDIQECSGTTKMNSLAQDGPILRHLGNDRAVLVLVDNDKEGRALLKNGKLDGGGRWVAHNSNKSIWCRLVLPTEFVAFMEELKIPTSHWPGSLENLFPPSLRVEATKAGKYALTSIPHDELMDRAIYKLIAPYLASEDPRKFFILAPEPDKKLEFANWIVEQAKVNPKVLDPLRTVVEALDLLLQK
jgi:hypothetical protein